MMMTARKSILEQLRIEQLVPEAKERIKGQTLLDEDYMAIQTSQFRRKNR
jgi:hypothetical protein